MGMIGLSMSMPFAAEAFPITLFFVVQQKQWVM